MTSLKLVMCPDNGAKNMPKSHQNFEFCNFASFFPDAVLQIEKKISSVGAYLTILMQFYDIFGHIV